jgi:thioredoxin-dependent peroxiredoxin
MKVLNLLIGFLPFLGILGSLTLARATEGLKVGDTAPGFTLKDQSGKPVRLSDFKGKEFVILYFYPKDETPGCTKEACTFRDDLSWYKDHGVEVLGVSVDNQASHQKFATHYSLTFRILSDAGKKVTQRYGVLGPFGVAKRTTFVIDKEGVIRAVYPNVKVDGHSGELQKGLSELWTKA